MAAFLWLTDVLGVPSAGGRTVWSVLVLVLAAVGAVRLARAGVAAVDTPHEPWTPWVGAALFACAPVLVTTVQHAPGDSLVVALLPWVLVPLVRRADGWRAAAASAAWLGLAGAGTPPWALAALAAGLVTAVATSRRPGGTRQLARWSVLAALSSAWWVVAYVWEASYATDLTGLAATRLAVNGIADTLGLPTTAPVLTALLLLGPVAVAVSALALRVGRDRAVVAALLVLSAVAALVGVVGGGWPAWLPVPAGTARATDAVPAPWTILGGWLALAALVAWTPLVDHLLARLPRSWSWRPATATGLVAAGLAVLALVSVAGPVLAVQEQVSAPADTDTEQWAEVAAWSETAPPGRVLVLPAVTEGRVEPAVEHALRGRPWIARDTLPLSGPGATTALDTALGRLDRGHDGAGTATALRHLGISYVLLRNDVPAAADGERPVALVRHALVLQGASRVAAIGSPARGGDDTAAAAGVVDLGVRDPVGSLEIWALDEAADGSLHGGVPLSVAGSRRRRRPRRRRPGGRARPRARHPARRAGRPRVRQRTPAGRRPARRERPVRTGARTGGAAHRRAARLGAADDRLARCRRVPRRSERPPRPPTWTPRADASAPWRRRRSTATPSRRGSRGVDTSSASGGRSPSTA